MLLPNALTAFTNLRPRKLFASLKWISHLLWDYLQLVFYSIRCRRTWSCAGVCLFFAHANWHCNNEEVTDHSQVSVRPADTWRHLKMSFLFAIFHNSSWKLLGNRCLNSKNWNFGILARGGYAKMAKKLKFSNFVSFRYLSKFKLEIVLKSFSMLNLNRLNVLAPKNWV